MFDIQITNTHTKRKMIYYYDWILDLITSGLIEAKIELLTLKVVFIILGIFSNQLNS